MRVVTPAKHTLADGSMGLAGERRAIDEWRDRQPVVTRCAECDDTHHGTAASGREWHERHRRREHPQLAAQPKQRRGHRQQRDAAMRASEWKRERWGDT